MPRFFLDVFTILPYAISNFRSRSDPMRILFDSQETKFYNELKQKGYTINVIFIDTPEKLRIKRIAKREGCSFEEAKIIERIKEKEKTKSQLMLKKTKKISNFRKVTYF